jgi:hypothetical protein
MLSAKNILTTILISQLSYSFVSGSIFSKDSSFIHLLQSSINSSRQLVQKPATVLLSPAVRILYVAMALAGCVIRRLGGAEEVNNSRLIIDRAEEIIFVISFSPEIIQAFRTD